MKLEDWKRAHKMLGHQIFSIQSEIPGTLWYFMPRRVSDLAGLWVPTGAIISRLRVVQFDQLLNDAPIDAFYGVNGCPKVSRMMPNDRLEITFHAPLTRVWIATKEI